jgi:hypothetical protein
LIRRIDSLDAGSIPDRDLCKNARHHGGFEVRVERTMMLGSGYEVTIPQTLFPPPAICVNAAP